MVPIADTPRAFLGFEASVYRLFGAHSRYTSGPSELRGIGVSAIWCPQPLHLRPFWVSLHECIGDLVPTADTPRALLGFEASVYRLFGAHSRYTSGSSGLRGMPIADTPLALLDVESWVYLLFGARSRYTSGPSELRDVGVSAIWCS